MVRAGAIPSRALPRQRSCISSGSKSLVRSRGLEPPRLAALPPQSSASTNSATTAVLLGAVRRMLARLDRRGARRNRTCAAMQAKPMLNRNNVGRETTRRDEVTDFYSSEPAEWAISRTAVAYEAAVAVMEAKVDAIARGEEAELVWLLEHPPL